MAGLRPGRCYRQIERAYTRKSKYKRKAFIKAVPAIKIARFDLGDSKRDYDLKLDLVSMENLQIRHNSLESARQVLSRKLDAMNRPYHLKVRVYPHHAIRENKMITGAGADRMQTGMQRSFGRIIGSAAQVKKGAPIFSVYVAAAEKNAVTTVMKAATYKLPCRCRVETHVIKG
ncbi:MAG: 50S ribosomal protein L16 [Nanoarchaeota archaeon]|nr:50S ribosomal protein L16 [Nanoarchaeota archaeon]